jgi:hypothetical protein
MSTSTELLKKKFILAYEESEGVITEASRKSNVARQMYYYWMKNDPEFVKEIKQLDLTILEDIHKQMIKDAKGGKLNFWERLALMDRLGKSLGYITKQEVEHQGSVKTEIILPRGLE